MQCLIPFLSAVKHNPISGTEFLASSTHYRISEGILPLSSSSQLSVTTEVKHKGYMDFLSKQGTSRFISKLWSIEYHQIWNIPLCICSSHLTVFVLNTGLLTIKNLWTIFSVLILSKHNKMLTDTVIQYSYNQYPRLFYSKFRTRLSRYSITWNFPRLSITFSHFVNWRKCGCLYHLCKEPSVEMYYRAMTSKSRRNSRNIQQ